MKDYISHQLASRIVGKDLWRVKAGYMWPHPRYPTVWVGHDGNGYYLTTTPSEEQP